MRKERLPACVLTYIMILLLSGTSYSQGIEFDAERFSTLKWRNIGPVRGGRGADLERVVARDRRRGRLDDDVHHRVLAGAQRHGQGGDGEP